MKYAITFSIVVLVLMMCACDSPSSPPSEEPTDYLQTETAAEREARMAWWEDARFGMFIHWGLYAIPAGTHQGEQVERNGEWIMNNLEIPIAVYEQYAAQFEPDRFDASAWVRIAKEAGMKYMIITSKHHDGFGLWHSEVSQWDVEDASPYGKDILKELAKACKKEGMPLGFYYSIMDWHHPDAQAIWEPNYNQGRNSDQVNPNFERYLETYMKPQLKELLTDYGDIAVLWFDGEWIPDFTSEMGKDLYNFVRNLQPDIIINNRVDKGRKGMEGLNAEGNFAGDYGTPEQEIPDTGLEGVDWESCMTMNDTWGYKTFDHNWKSDTTLIRHLVDIASKGGNFLLNVGPTAEGVIPAPSVQRLKTMGNWLNVNGEAIYGAKASPFAKPAWGRYTAKGDRVYLHVFNWPASGQLSLPELTEATSARLLAGDQPLELQTGPNGLILQLPAIAPDPIATVIAVDTSP